MEAIQIRKLKANLFRISNLRKTIKTGLNEQQPCKYSLLWQAKPNILEHSITNFDNELLST